LRSESLDLSVNEILDLALVILISGIVGARLLHVGLNTDYYFKYPIEIIMLQHGGLAYQGGLILAVISSILFIKAKKRPVWKTADFIIPYVALGQSIGRIGCFLNGCCYGKKTNFLGVLFPDQNWPVYPTELFYSLSLLGIFVLLSILRQNKQFEGQVLASYLLLYGVMRFSIDFLRGDLHIYQIGLTMTQIISIGIIIFSVIFYLYLKRWKK
jgi:phosphatidylglycerol:prolipoprotein diacylglycerol transferase